MVFKLIKSIFKKEEVSDCTGVLVQNNVEVLPSCTIDIIDTNLVFKSKNHTEKFNINKISDIELDGTTLVFTYIHKKYKYLANKDISNIYNSLHPIIGACETTYDCSKLKYYIYDSNKELFSEVNELVRLRIIIDNNLYYLKVETSHDVIHFEEITTEAQYYMDNKANTFVWSVLKNNIWHTFSIKFESSIDYLEFLSRYVSSTYKSAHEKGNSENEKYFEKMEIENYNEIDVFDEEEGESDEYCSLSGEKEEEIDDQERVLNEFGDKNEKNELLVVSNDMAFVTRGSSVGVFKNKEDGLEFKENLHNVLQDPAKKMTTHKDSLIYLNKNEDNKLHKIDLERSDVVETWDIGRSVNDYFDSTKMVDSETLVGLSDYSIFRIDPRTKEKITESKDYKTKNDFLCGMSTSKGHVVTASRNGDLRLYDKIDKRAKSLLPGYGEEIKYVDVTRNGKYIICTCKNYLMLFSVDGNYKNPVGKNKPVPKRLQLRPEHLAYINEEINFTPAKFSTDNLEDSIITSTGKYVVKWKLDDVLNGSIYSYHITRCNDLVVADNFEFGDTDNIIVTLPNDVRSLRADVLKRPNRKTF